MTSAVDTARPGPDPVTPTDRDRYLDSLGALLPGFRERAAATEDQGRVCDATMEELSDAGVFTALQPSAWGGLELHPATFFEGAVLVGSACPSTGWIAAVLGVHAWELGCMEPEAQADVWSEKPRTRLSSSYAPTGAARRNGDGYTVSGRWGFSSGVDHCDWALLAAFVEGEEKRGPRVFLIPRSDVSIDQGSWDVTGLAGTGSKAVEVTEAAVPAHRTHLMAEINDPSWERPGWQVSRNPLYQHGFRDLFSWGIGAPALGAATGFAEEWIRQSRSRKPALGGPPVAENPDHQLRLAEGLNRIDVLRRSMVSSWQEVHDGVAAHGPADDPIQLRHRYLGSRTIGDSLDAALAMFAAAGGGVMFATNPLQRFIRDLLAMRNHPVASLQRFAGDLAVDELTR